MHRDFSLQFPDTVEDVLELLAEGDPGVRVIAGGTGIVPLLKHDVFRPRLLVSLQRLAPALSALEPDGDGGYLLGASVTLRSLERSRPLTETYPLLAQALRVLATVRVRNVAQLGGAIAHAHPQTDLPPVLVSLGARIRARSRGGERWIEAGDFFHGYYQSALRDDEMVTEVRLPPPGRHRAVYRKVTERTVDDWPLLGVVVTTWPEGSSARVRVVLGAVADRPVALPEMTLPTRPAGIGQAEAALRDVIVDLELSDRPGASARYQRQLIAVHAARAITDVLVDLDREGES